MNWKLVGVLFGVAVASTITVKVIQSMSDKIDKSEVAKDAAKGVAESVKDQVTEEEV